MPAGQTPQPAATVSAPLTPAEAPKPVVSQLPSELLELSIRLDQVFSTEEWDSKRKVEEMFRLYQEAVQE
jgi:hypothetical protein